MAFTASMCQSVCFCVCAPILLVSHIRLEVVMKKIENWAKVTERARKPMREEGIIVFLLHWLSGCFFLICLTVRLFMS